MAPVKLPRAHRVVKRNAKGVVIYWYQGRINNLLDTDASTLVPGQSSLQREAFGSAAGLGAGWQGSTAAATDRAGYLSGAPMVAQRSAGQTLLGADLEGYQNPWEDQVVGTTLAGFDETAGMNRAALAAQQARGQKFSGSGSAIERAMFERGSAQDRAGIEATLRSQGFDRATELASRDLDRTQQNRQFNASQGNSMSVAERDAMLRGTGLLGDLSNSAAANERADLGLLSDLGGQQREVERQQLGAEANLLSLIAALNGSQPYGLFRGQTTQADGTTTSKGKESGLGTAMESIGGLLQGAGDAASGYAALAALSDKRTKENIKTVGRDARGRRVVSYRYKGEPKDVSRIGYIAQEIEKTDPHAVTKGPGGYKMVAYGLLSDGIAA
ncbi:MAG: tail fiber domain-containing protein [Pseudomonadota bacterium]